MSVEEVDDEDNIQPKKGIPKKGSRILERADGGDDDEPIYVDQDSSDVATEIDDSGDDSPEESAEVELSKCERMSLFQI